MSWRRNGGMPDPRSAFHSATLSTESNADKCWQMMNVIVVLLKMKCLPCLYYRLEACRLIQSPLRSWEFAVNSAFRKIFSIKSYDVVSDYVKYFNCSVSNSIYKRKRNFLAKLKCSDNILIGLFSNVISMELSGLQLPTELCIHLIWVWYSTLFYPFTFLILVKYN